MRKRLEECLRLANNSVTEAELEAIGDGKTMSLADANKIMVDTLLKNGVVVPVRCKDCKHYDNSEGINWCKLNSHFHTGGFDWHSFPEDGFCSYGERSTDA